ncbi:MAG: hypothetical protein JXR29_10280 [Methylothermaceae bacterium]|nr:hypothetical protein [Methylothermaceae bacterium]
MKAAFIILAIFAVIFILPVTCSGSREIHASSLNTAYKSARMVKNYIRDDAKRLEFQMAFGTLQQIKTDEGGPEAFLDAVDGKDADEIIALAREEVNARITQGDERYAQYQNWENMVEQLTKNTPKVLGSEREQRAFE